MWKRTIRLCLLVGLALPGCVWLDPVSSPAPTPVPTATPTPIPERFVHVSKAQRRLTVYDGNEAIKVFPVVLGKDPVGAKLHQGDHRTPEGEYVISSKYYHAGWTRFMLLDYPNDHNWEIYSWAQRYDVLPRHRGRVPGIGGAVGIHGTYDDNVNRLGKDWTEGCISLETLHIIQLYDLVDVGTRVVIDH